MALERTDQAGGKLQVPLQIGPQKAAVVLGGNGELHGCAPFFFDAIIIPEKRDRDKGFLEIRVKKR